MLFAKPFPPRPVRSPLTAGNSPPGSRRPDSTSVPPSNCLALASTLGWRRRCCGASRGTLLASRFDSEQGTSEKIILQRFFRQSCLQPGDLIPVRFLFAVFRGCSQIGVSRLRAPLKLVLPGVQELPFQLQFACQGTHVFAGLHLFDNLPFELHTVSTPLSLLGHLASFRCQGASFQRVSLF